MFFFVYKKMVNTNKESERKYVKDIKIFLEKRIKGKQNAKKRFQNFTEEEKEKRRQYY